MWANFKLPDGVVSKMLSVTLTNTKFKIALKAKPNEPIIEGEFNKRIKCDESTWSLESDGEKRELQLNIQKQEG